MLVDFEMIMKARARAEKTCCEGDASRKKGTLKIAAATAEQGYTLGARIMMDYTARFYNVLGP